MLDQSDLYISGRGGYHTYRIPAMVVSARGTVLAFCEGRKGAKKTFCQYGLTAPARAVNGDHCVFF